MTTTRKQIRPIVSPRGVRETTQHVLESDEARLREVLTKHSTLVQETPTLDDITAPMLVLCRGCGAPQDWDDDDAGVCRRCGMPADDETTDEHETGGIGAATEAV